MVSFRDVNGDGRLDLVIHWREIKRVLTALIAWYSPFIRFSLPAASPLLG